MTAVAPDVNTIEHLDVGLEPVCDNPECPDGRPPAKHFTRPLRCGCPGSVLCDGCAAPLYRYLEYRWGHIACAKCGDAAHGVLGRTFYLVAPL